MFESSTVRLTFETSTLTPVRAILGKEDSCESVDIVTLFETEMYLSRMHDGHGKTSSFKRCMFLKRIWTANVANILITAVEDLSSPLWPSTARRTALLLAVETETLLAL